MERDAAIATLKAHEAELKRLGVQHLYLFGSTARDEARDDSDVDLFFDYEKGELSLFGLMEVKEQAARILGRKTDIMTRDSIHKVLRARRSLRAASVLMAERSPAARLTDMVEAIDLIRDEMAGVTLDAFQPDMRKRWLIERGIEIISEASRRLPDELKARHPDIPWRKVAGIGNVLRHNYEDIAAPVMWALVRDDLPPLEKVCREELAAEQGRGSHE